MNVFRIAPRALAVYGLIVVLAIVVAVRDRHQTARIDELQSRLDQIDAEGEKGAVLSGNTHRIYRLERGLFEVNPTWTPWVRP